MLHRRVLPVGAVCVCLLGICRIAWFHFAVEVAMEQPIDARFADVRAILPEHGEVGFISDAAEAVSSQRAYLRASFALAPLVLVHSKPGVDWIVGDLKDPSRAGRMGREVGASVVLKKSDGLVVFHRSGQQRQ